MSSSSGLVPHPGNTGRPTTSHEAMPEITHPALPSSAILTPSTSRTAEQTPSYFEHQRQEKSQGTRTQPGDTPHSLKPIRLSLNVEVERRSLDPLILGVLMGAIIAILGLVIGLYAVRVI